MITYYVRVSITRRGIFFIIPRKKKKTTDTQALESNLFAQPHTWLGLRALPTASVFAYSIYIHVYIHIHIGRKSKRERERTRRFAPGDSCCALARARATWKRRPRSQPRFILLSFCSPSLAAARYSRPYTHLYNTEDCVT